MASLKSLNALHKKRPSYREKDFSITTTNWKTASKGARAGTSIGFSQKKKGKGKARWANS
jgi:hypothetical protein